MVLVQFFDPLFYVETMGLPAELDGPLIGPALALVSGDQADLVCRYTFPRQMDDAAPVRYGLGEVLRADPFGEETQRVEDVALAARVDADEDV